MIIGQIKINAIKFRSIACIQGDLEMANGANEIHIKYYTGYSEVCPNINI